MLKHQIINKFKKSFNFDKNQLSRGIGIECEIPIVEEQGSAVSLPVIQQMFLYLGRIGFELEHDDYSDLIIAAKRVNKKSLANFDYPTDTITTDTAYSTVEVVLAPQANLYTIQSELNKLLFLLKTYFDSQNCLMLACGIQPLSPPSRKLLMPKERYCFFEKFSTNHIIPKSKGADSSLLNTTASAQCHIEIGLDDAILATNVLNALSGLQIALHANSPIWQGKIDPEYKATREMIWDFCFPDRCNQIGIPPEFETIENYIEYLLNFKPLLVKRREQYFQIINKNTFNDFLFHQSPAIGRSLSGKKVRIEPQPNDIQQLIPFSWFNARLVPKYGTVESRMCCQQPQSEMLTPTAVALGLVENLEAAQNLAKIYPLSKWRKIRKQTAQYALEATIDGLSIIPLLLQFLDIANEGLRKRNLGEEVFLQPLYQRIEQRKVPADLAIEVFKNHGMNAFLEYVSFKKEAISNQPEISKHIVHF